MIRKSIERDIKISSRDKVSIDLPLTLYSSDDNNFSIKLNLKDENGISLLSEQIKNVLVYFVLKIENVNVREHLELKELREDGSVLINYFPYDLYTTQDKQGIYSLNLYTVDNDGSITDVGEVRFKVKLSAINHSYYFTRNHEQPNTEYVIDYDWDSDGQEERDMGEFTEKMQIFSVANKSQFPDLEIVLKEGKPRVVRKGFKKSNTESSSIGGGMDSGNWSPTQ